MSPTRHAPRTILVAALVVLAGTALAGTADDAGTGMDAGDTRAAALSVAYGSYTGYLHSRDWDWYAAGSASSMPRCVQVTTSAENNVTARLTTVSPDGERSTGARLAASSATLALAVPALTRAYFDVTASPNDPLQGDPARPGAYAFSIAETGVPTPSAGDALSGMDAGNDISRALPAPGSCFGGRVSPVAGLGDVRDVYSIQVADGQAVTYGFAAGGAPGEATLTLLAANGTAAGPTLTSGQRASVAVPTPGTYYLSVARTNVGAEDVGYVVSVVLGPPDPNGCRPYC